jgi:hypothetical protein
MTTMYLCKCTVGAPNYVPNAWKLDEVALLVVNFAAPFHTTDIIKSEPFS